MIYFKIKFLLWGSRQYYRVGALFMLASKALLLVCQGCEKRSTRLNNRAKEILSSAMEQKR